MALILCGAKSILEYFAPDQADLPLRFALAVEYEGQGFHGWQSQLDHVRSAQQTLELAIAKVANHPVRLHCAGRTDAGVHASMQLVHFDTRAIRPLHGWLMGINSALANDISVQWIQPTNHYFHARFCARERQYAYVLYNHPVAPGIMRSQLTWERKPLSVELMQAAADRLLGQHDFSSFRAADCQAQSPIKELRQLQFQQRGPLIILTARANSFLYHMVRNLMGSLILIGQGAKPVTWVDELLAGRDRRLAGPTALPNGLYFTGAQYDPVHSLPSTLGLPGFLHE